MLGLREKLRGSRHKVEKCAPSPTTHSDVTLGEVSNYNPRWQHQKLVNNGEVLSSRNTQKENFPSPQWESNPWPSRYRLDALNTELWETRGEQGHILGSYMWDMCPAILQGSSCRNDKYELMMNWIGDLDKVYHLFTFRHGEPCNMAGHASYIYM